MCNSLLLVKLLAQLTKLSNIQKVTKNLEKSESDF